MMRMVTVLLLLLAMIASRSSPRAHPAHTCCKVSISLLQLLEPLLRIPRPIHLPHTLSYQLLLLLLLMLMLFIAPLLPLLPLLRIPRPIPLPLDTKTHTLPPPPHRTDLLFTTPLLPL